MPRRKTIVCGGVIVEVQCAKFAARNGDDLSAEPHANDVMHHRRTTCPGGRHSTYLLHPQVLRIQGKPNKHNHFSCKSPCRRISRDAYVICSRFWSTGAPDCSFRPIMSQLMPSHLPVLLPVFTLPRSTSDFSSDTLRWKRITALM
jgi:hypothetical protein